MRSYMQWYIDRDSQYYNAFMLAGFSLVKYEFLQRYDHAVVLRFMIQCVCGQLEVGQVVNRVSDASKYFDETTGLVDFARAIEEYGALSPKHLKQDGYGYEDIVRIRKPFTDMYAREGIADPYPITTPELRLDFGIMLDTEALAKYAVPKKKIPYWQQINMEYRLKYARV